MTLSPPADAALSALREVLAPPVPQIFRIRLWDGTEWAPEGADIRFTLIVRRPGALRNLARPGNEAALAEAYLRGELEVEGDVFSAAEVGRAIAEKPRGLLERARIGFHLWNAARKASRTETPRRGDEAGEPMPAADLRGERHTPERDRAAVVHHYDLSNRFYRAFLDPAMVYTCAVFSHPGEDLASAQRRKLDLVCRKLRLRAGDRLLDIGCGWGALLLHAAREYGAETVGITLSERQAEMARETIRQAGLGSSCRVELRDYRTVEGTGVFDKVASLGMFEHVGRERGPEYFGVVHRLLRPGGAYLHHAITADARLPAGRVSTLAHRFVFPDHDIVPICDTIAFAETAGFDVRDVENLREHYALTLRCWVDGLERRRADVVEEVGEASWRAWRLVFAGAARDFETGRKGLFQTLLVKAGPDGDAGLPPGREDWYA